MLHSRLRFASSNPIAPQKEPSTNMGKTRMASIPSASNIFLSPAGNSSVRPLIGSPMEEDLKVWQHSGLGRRFLEHRHDELSHLSLDRQQFEAVRILLSNNVKGSKVFTEEEL